MNGSLGRLVQTTLETFDCIFEQIEEGFIKIITPRGCPLNEVLDIEGTAYLVLTQYEEDILAGYEPLRHLFPGSYFLDRLIGFLSQQGKIADIRLPSRFEAPSHETIRPVLKALLPESSEIEIKEPSETLHRCVTFHFLIDLLANVPQRTAVTVTVNVETNHLLDDPDLESLAHFSPYRLPLSFEEVAESYRLALCRAFAIAQGRIESYRIAQEPHWRQAEIVLGEHLKRELRQLEASPGWLELSEDEREKRRLAFRSEWQSRTLQVRNQYTAEGASLTLVGATRQVRPVCTYDIQIKWEDDRESAIILLFDAYAGCVLSSYCPTCKQETDRLEPGAPPCEHLVCPFCLRTCGGCGLSFCDGHINRCCICGGFSCDDCWDPGEALSGEERCCAPCAAKRLTCSACGHRSWPETRECKICARPLCQDCRITCVECGDVVCEDHAEVCHRCRSSFCPACESLHAEREMGAATLRESRRPLH